MKINHLLLAALLFISNICSAGIVGIGTSEAVYRNGVLVDSSSSPYVTVYNNGSTLEAGAEVSFGVDDIFGMTPFLRSKSRTTTFTVTGDAPFSLDLSGYIQFGTPSASAVASLFEDGALLGSYQLVSPGGFVEQSLYGTLLSGKIYSLKLDLTLHSSEDSVNPLYVNATLQAVPVPPAFLLMLSGLCSVAGAGFLRRRVA